MIGEPEVSASVFNLVVNGGAMAILAYLAVYLIPKWMDSTGKAFSELVTTFKNEQVYEREMCAKQFNGIMEVLKSNQESLNRTLTAVQAQIEQHQKFSEIAVSKLVGKRS
jgi:hypothetical protein